jgi:hypothetical protein
MSAEKSKTTCGIVMPISAIDGCNESHWNEVYGIVSEAVNNANFSPNLVSNANEVSFIHQTIIQNLYQNQIVICDVSGRNPNVMFELGIRLAFDKPTIIIKDDATPYSFDTSPIEHLEYPRDLRFNKIVDFKEKLTKKISATFDASKDAKYSPFLKHFGTFTIGKIESKEINQTEYILAELQSIKNEIKNQQKNSYDLDTGKWATLPAFLRPLEEIKKGASSKRHRILEVEFSHDITTKIPEIREHMLIALKRVVDFDLKLVNPKTLNIFFTSDFKMAHLEIMDVFKSLNLDITQFTMG